MSEIPGDNEAAEKFLKHRGSHKDRVERIMEERDMPLFSAHDVKAAFLAGIRVGRITAWRSSEPSPTLEPVPVEDITPGWYWNVMTMQDEGTSTVLTRVSKHTNHLRAYDNTIDGSGRPLAKTSDKISWYRAPSPEQLMAMCGKAQPATLDINATHDGAETVNAKGGQGGSGGAGGVVNFIPSGIPPAIEVALRVLESPHEHMPASSDAWNIVRDYLSEHALKEQPTDEPTNTRPCGE